MNGPGEESESPSAGARASGGGAPRAHNRRGHPMNRFDGSAAHQLVLIDEGTTPIVRWEPDARPKPSLRLLQRDIYSELAKRRRRAQIAARHLIDR